MRIVRGFVKKILITLGLVVFGLSYEVVFSGDNEMLRQMLKGMTIKAHLDLALRNPGTPENIKFLEDQVMVIDVGYMLSRLGKPEDRNISNTLERIKSLLVMNYGYSRTDFDNSDRLSPAKSISSSPYTASESPCTVLSSEGSGKLSYLSLSRFSPIPMVKKKP